MQKIHVMRGSDTYFAFVEGALPDDGKKFSSFLIFLFPACKTRTHLYFEDDEVFAGPGLT